MCGKTVLILVLIVVETLVGNDLRDGERLVVYDRDRDLARLDELLYKDLLMVRSRIVDGSLIFLLGFNDGYTAGRSVADRLYDAGNAYFF